MDGPTGEEVTLSGGIVGHGNFLTEVVLGVVNGRSACACRNSAVILIGYGELISLEVYLQYGAAVCCNSAAEDVGSSAVKSETDVFNVGAYGYVLVGNHVGYFIVVVRNGGVVSVSVHEIMLDSVLVGICGVAAGEDYLGNSGNSELVIGSDDQIKLIEPTVESVALNGGDIGYNSGCSIGGVYICGEDSAGGNGTGELVLDHGVHTLVIELKYQRTVGGYIAGNSTETCIVAEADNAGVGNGLCVCQSAGGTAESFGSEESVVGSIIVVSTVNLLPIMLNGVGGVGVCVERAVEDDVGIGHLHLAVYNGGVSGVDRPTGEYIALSGGIVGNGNFLTEVVLGVVNGQGACACGNGAVILVAYGELISLEVNLQYGASVCGNGAGENVGSSAVIGEAYVLNISAYGYVLVGNYVGDIIIVVSNSGIVSVGVHEIMLDSVLVGICGKVAGEGHVACGHVEQPVHNIKIDSGSPAGESIAIGGGSALNADRFAVAGSVLSDQLNAAGESVTGGGVAGDSTGVLVGDGMYGAVVVESQCKRGTVGDDTGTGRCRLIRVEGETGDLIAGAGHGSGGAVRGTMECLGEVSS